MSDWLNKVIGNNLETVYEGLYATEDALLWLRQKPRTFGELRAADIDWLRWMATNIHDQDLLEDLSGDSDADVRMWVACNPMTPKPVLVAARRRSSRLCSQRSCSKQQHAGAFIGETGG